jgi:DNA-binding PadR family transcriptional regulator
MALRYALLGELVDRERSGYELVQRFAATMNFVWTASQGAIYTELVRLELEGLIEEASTGPRGRRSYRATAAGRAALRAWLLSPMTRQAKDELVLRVFHLGVLSQDEAAAYFGRLAEQYAERLEVYERRLDGLGPDDTVADYDRIALLGGIAHERAMLAWALESAERLGADVRASSGDRAR